MSVGHALNKPVDALKHIGSVVFKAHAGILAA
jgi:hypothetical protein